MRGDVHVGCGQAAQGDGPVATPAPRPGPTSLPLGARSRTPKVIRGSGLFTRDELQALFRDYADDQVTVIRAAGAGGWRRRFPGRRAVQGRLRIRAAPRRDSDAGHC